MYGQFAIAVVVTVESTARRPRATSTSTSTNSRQCHCAATIHEARVQRLFHSPFTIHHSPPMPLPNPYSNHLPGLELFAAMAGLPQPQHANAQGRASAPRVSGRGRPGAETRGATAFASAGRTRFNRQPLATRRVLAQPAATPGPGGDSAGRWGAAAGAAAVPEQALGPRGDPTHVWPRHRLAGLAAG